MPPVTSVPCEPPNAGAYCSTLPGVMTGMIAPVSRGIFKHARHFTRQQNVRRLKFTDEIDEDIFSGNDRRAAHRVQRHIALHQRHQAMLQRCAQHKRIEIG